MSDKAIRVIAKHMRGNDRLAAEQVLAALKNAGIVVVELPETVIDEMGAPTWSVEQHWRGRQIQSGEVRIRVTDKKISANSVSNPSDCPDDAQSLAVALLAAVSYVDGAK